MQNILVTGGAGYIGSHMVRELINNDYNPIILDSYLTSSDKNIKTIEKLTGKTIEIVKLDIRDDLSVLNSKNIEGIVHFAALKAVGESVKKPLEYYENNVYGSINLLKWARDNNLKKFIFSSTASVYGNPPTEQVDEKTPTSPMSPYGRTKLMMEEIIKDSYTAFGLNSVVLRYFNVAGNVDDGSIGDLNNNPQNLIPIIIMSHLKLIPNKMTVLGNDYPTRDGTGVRDYIHVMDLIDAHIKALKYLDNHKGSHLFNLGTGKGLSVMEIINAFEKVSGEKLDYEIAPRREGDVASITTDHSLARAELGWEAKKTVEEMIESMWKWYKNNFQITNSK